ncbi:uncharacterized protein BXIN_0785 [Babesia sp. Xinjiang]|uniref:uncharacterized protein n=1 Tax=Babesia sp. Xinjiang TaxID=462227 RepID=UPI000A23C7EE|nr:uncharacterized protein BXIN_0785 [Babesia sp. Xinjiang]ORM41339.1 hypothetical protein BXIN_0785 [Babesia sp. Xinjiang]
MDSDVLKEAEEPQTQEPEISEDSNTGEVVVANGEDFGDAEHLAEVILVTTSLGGMKQQFFQSKMAQHILDCKGLVYYLVDANRDFTRAAVLKDHLLYEQWSTEGVLTSEDVGDRKSVTLPQLIVDGVSVGSTKEIQDLEDDGDLDYIIARMICPKCSATKPQDALQCPHCNAQYRMLIPMDYRDGVDIQRLCQGVPIVAEEE